MTINLLTFGSALIVALGVFNKTAKNAFKIPKTINFKKPYYFPLPGMTLLDADSADLAADTSVKQGLALYKQGKEKGDSNLLRQSVEILQQQLCVISRQEMPMEWAKAQNDLGNALRTLGELELSVQHLNGALKSYRDALQEFTRNRYPIQWAKVQNNLGNTFHLLAGFESGTVYLTEAVKAYLAALEEFPQWRSPFYWAKIQSGLGSALAVLGRRESSSTSLQGAVNAYRKALEVFESCETPEAMHYIGATLRNLQQVESFLAKLRKKY